MPKTMDVSTRLLLISGLLVAVYVYPARSAVDLKQNATVTTTNSTTGDIISSSYTQTDIQNSVISSPTVKNDTKESGAAEDGAGMYPTVWYEQSSLIVDLSYSLNSGTITLSDHKPFKYIVEHEGYSVDEQNERYFWKLDSFSTGIHTGTHIDAPLHFNQNGWSMDMVPLTRLIGVPVVVVDLSAKVRQNRSYEFQGSDFWNLNIRSKSLVLVYTGISEDYKRGLRPYYGMREADSIKSHIPGFSANAARYLVSRGIYGVGLDSPSADSSNNDAPDGPLHSKAHRIFAGSNVYILEHLTSNLKLLTINSKRIDIFILPLAITGASGSPVRVVAIRRPLDS